MQRIVDIHVGWFYDQKRCQSYFCFWPQKLRQMTDSCCVNAYWAGFQWVHIESPTARYSPTLLHKIEKLKKKIKYLLTLLKSLCKV